MLFGAETFCTCYSSLSLERKHVVGGPRWGNTQNHVPDVSGFLLIHIFLAVALGLSIFALINLSHEYNLLLSLVSKSFQ